MESPTLTVIKQSLKQAASQGKGGTEGFLDKSFLGWIYFTGKEAAPGRKSTLVLLGGTGTTGIMKHKP